MKYQYKMTFSSPNEKVIEQFFTMEEMIAKVRKIYKKLGYFYLKYDDDAVRSLEKVFLENNITFTFKKI